MTYQFQTSDFVCSRMIEIELDDRGERVKRVQFVGGCPGNLAGIGRLAAGMTPEELIDRLQGSLECGGGMFRTAEQLATALREIAAKKNA